MQMHCAELEDRPLRLMGHGSTPFGSRIVSLQVSAEAGLLVCGDQLGNLSVFAAPLLKASSEGDAVPHTAAGPAQPLCCLADCFKRSIEANDA